MTELQTGDNGARAGDGVLGIEFAAPGSLARRVVSRSNTRPTGRYPSFRVGRALCWDSVAELNWFRLLDCNPAVTQVAEQPCVVHYRLDGKYYRHFPDCLVRTTTTQTLWEVKTSADARRPDIAARTRMLTAHLPRHGYQYGVVLAEDLRREPRLRNARFLLRHGRTPLSFEEREFTRRLLEQCSSLRWQDVVDGRHAPLTLGVACHLVLDGCMYLDLDRPMDTRALLLPVRNSVVTHGVAHA